MKEYKVNSRWLSGRIADHVPPRLGTTRGGPRRGGPLLSADEEAIVKKITPNPRGKRKTRMYLTAQHFLFVKEYMIDLDHKKAAERMGLNLQKVRKWMKDPGILEEIENETRRKIRRASITSDRVLEELAKLGFADIRNALTFGKTGVRVKESDEIDDETASAIAEVSEGRHGMRLKMHDKKGALDSIGRHLGMFQDNLNVKGDLSVEVVDYSGEEKKKDDQL